MMRNKHRSYWHTQCYFIHGTMPWLTSHARASHLHSSHASQESCLMIRQSSRTLVKAASGYGFRAS